MTLSLQHPGVGSGSQAGALLIADHPNLERSPTHICGPQSTFARKEDAGCSNIPKIVQQQTDLHVITYAISGRHVTPYSQSRISSLRVMQMNWEAIIIQGTNWLKINNVVQCKLNIVRQMSIKNYVWLTERKQLETYLDVAAATFYVDSIKVLRCFFCPPLLSSYPPLAVSQSEK